VISYDVRVEKGLPYNVDEVAATIHQILNDDRSWVGTGQWRFKLVGPGEKADLHAYLATPKTTDDLCFPLLTGGEVSCRNGDRVVLNAKRWAFGAEAYGEDVTNYRRYLVNHEFGHALGFGHVECPGRGKPAPIMMQQTKGLDGCKRNPWPAGDD
jgi:ssRNA-specific RNase YbeY (16S rRNA maturation enzyme)